MGEGWLPLLKWLPPLKLSKVGLFRGTYHSTCGPRDLTVLHRRDVGLRIEPYNTRSKDVLISSGFQWRGFRLLEKPNSQLSLELGSRHLGDRPGGVRDPGYTRQRDPR
jgi:hypothetical protein